MSSATHRLAAWGLAATAALAPPAFAQYRQDGQDGAPPTRPAPKSNRWQEDWSALADPALRTQPLDGLKYLSLSDTDPARYLSIGATLRERVESNSAPALGAGGARADTWLLQRLQLHADLHLDARWRAFVQLEDDRAFDKRAVSPADQDRLDLRLAFVERVERLASGVLKARLGRQDFAFDLQRFISSRDGPNVRQSFDAAWIDWETAQWRFIGLASRPVQYQDGHPFDDSSGPANRFGLLRVERHVLGGNELSAYVARYQRDTARYGDAAGPERRDALDGRFAGAAAGLDWDLEAMLQAGHVGTATIRAWALGARAGWTATGLAWRPRAGLQVDASSGDRRPGDGRLGTFNPLFPNGYYYTLAGDTGDANLVHLKPSLTLAPATGLALTLAAGFTWRQTVADSVYTQPNVPLPGTAGRGERWSGRYQQLRADLAITPQLAGAVEAVAYQAGDTIRAAGGRDGRYLGVELKASW